MNGIAFDAGGLIALDRYERRVIVLLARAADLAYALSFRLQRWLRRCVTLPDRHAFPG